MTEPLRNQQRPDDAAPPPRPLSPNEARQGVAGRPVLVVLAAGLVLAMVAWGVAELWGVWIDPDASQTTQSPSPPAAGQASDGAPAGPASFDNNPGDGSTTPPAQTDRDPTAPTSTGGESQQQLPGQQQN